MYDSLIHHSMNFMAKVCFVRQGNDENIYILPIRRKSVIRVKRPFNGQKTLYVLSQFMPEMEECVCVVLPCDEVFISSNLGTSPCR